MARSKPLIVAMGIVLMLAACGVRTSPDIDPGPTGGPIILGGDVPASVRDRDPLPSCGVETATGQDGPWNEDGRRCLLAAAEDGRRAEFVSTRVTVEGDPIRSVYRVLGSGEFEVLIDSTRDAFGSGRWERYRCARLAIIANDHPKPDFGVDDTCDVVPVP